MARCSDAYAVAQFAPALEAALGLLAMRRCAQERAGQPRGIPFRTGQQGGFADKLLINTTANEKALVDESAGFRPRSATWPGTC